MYTQVTYFAQSAPRPNPQPLPCEGRGVRFKAPLRVGEGFGERSADLCVHRSLNKERDRFCTAFIRVRYLQGCSINLKTPSTTTCVYTVAFIRRGIEGEVSDPDINCMLFNSKETRLIASPTFCTDKDFSRLNLHALTAMLHHKRPQPRLTIPYSFLG